MLTNVLLTIQSEVIAKRVGIWRGKLAAKMLLRQKQSELVQTVVNFHILNAIYHEEINDPSLETVRRKALEDAKQADPRDEQAVSDAAYRLSMLLDIKQSLPGYQRAIEDLRKSIDYLLE